MCPFSRVFTCSCRVVTLVPSLHHQVPQSNLHLTQLQWIYVERGFGGNASPRQSISRGSHIFWQSQVQADTGESPAACSLVRGAQGSSLPQSAGEAAPLPNDTAHIHPGEHAIPCCVCAHTVKCVLGQMKSYNYICQLLKVVKWSLG